MDIKRQKNALRSLYREKRREVSPEERKRLDDRICRAVIASASFRYCEHLLLYCPIGEEVDVLPLAELALSQGKKVGSTPLPLRMRRPAGPSAVGTRGITLKSWRSYRGRMPMP